MTLTRRALILRYVGFAIAATAANLGTQHLSLLAYGGAHAINLSILVGTGVGFLLKYILDKRFIFFDATGTGRAEAWKALLYGVTGVATTLIFWGFELGAWNLFRTVPAKFMGAILGLAIGYVAKYQLDRRFVFQPPAAA